MGHTDNSIVIEAPIAYVWARTNDLRSWTDLFTEYAKVEVLSEEPGHLTFRLTMHPDEEGRVWSWVSERRLDREHWTVRARRVEPGPFQFMNLYWTYEALTPDTTRLRWVQDFTMRPDAPVDDAAMEARLNRGSAGQLRIIAQRLKASRSRTQSFAATRSVRQRGGDMRTLLNPASTGCSNGISGAVELAPGERVNEHYHPYSEEHLFVAEGTVRVDIDGEPRTLGPREAVFVPRQVRHRVTNVGTGPALVVFALGPLAPSPELGHVDTEDEAPAAT
ncbi:cupin domain-containing protein [Nonomuraea bangladeshensis]|uniref:Cupin domain-containing protein n=1 Tax=Nonomuraea bangladeshensis TaxID=404385 RepID=A0ABV3HJM4_9ACTN